MIIFWRLNSKADGICGEWVHWWAGSDRPTNSLYFNFLLLSSLISCTLTTWHFAWILDSKNRVGCFLRILAGAALFKYKYEKEEEDGEDEEEDSEKAKCWQPSEAWFSWVSCSQPRSLVSDIANLDNTSERQLLSGLILLVGNPEFTLHNQYILLAPLHSSMIDDMKDTDWYFSRFSSLFLGPRGPLEYLHFPCQKSGSAFQPIYTDALMLMRWWLWWWWCNEDASRMHWGCNKDQDATRIKMQRGSRCNEN